MVYWVLQEPFCVGLRKTGRLGGDDRLRQIGLYSLLLMKPHKLSEPVARRLWTMKITLEPGSGRPGALHDDPGNLI